MKSKVKTKAVKKTNPFVKDFIFISSVIAITMILDKIWKAFIM